MDEDAHDLDIKILFNFFFFKKKNLALFPSLMSARSLMRQLFLKDTRIKMHTWKLSKTKKEKKMFIP